MNAAEYLRENHKQEVFFNTKNRAHYMNEMFHGYDMDRTMLRIGAMNMMTHGIENPSIEYRDSLSDQNPDAAKYSLILANPPFKGSLDYDIVSADLLKTCKTKKTELLFIALFLRMLRVVYRAVSANAARRRTVRLHCSGRRAVRLVQGAQGDPHGIGGEQPA